MKLLINFRDNNDTLELVFASEQERDKAFSDIVRSMSKVTLDVWQSPEVAIKIAEIVYIQKDI